MRTVQVYVDDVRLDLFEDEDVVVTSTIQNINDISKIFTDYSQTLSVPASKVNNEVFKHYYNNDVSGVSISKERIPSRVEINHTPFRVGKMQLEGASINNNQADSYKITFYGDIVTLKDKFGDDKLKDLNYDSLSEVYDGANIKANISSTADENIRYPLMTSDRIWQYNTGGGVDDINGVTGAIVFDELFPALKVSKIFEFIQAEYNLTFIGNFLTDKRFTNMYTLWKNRKTPVLGLQPTDITFDKAGSDYFKTNFVELTYLKPKSYTPPLYDASLTTNSRYDLTLFHSCNNTGLSYSIDVYREGISPNGNIFNNGIVQTFEFVNIVAGAQTTVEVLTTQGVNIPDATVWKYSYKIRSNDAVTIFDVDIRAVHNYNVRVLVSDTPISLSDTFICEIANVDNPFVLSNFMDFTMSAPDMKISTYFSGILSEFNLTCVPQQDGTTFKIEPLRAWYEAGGEVDITPYVITDSIKISRPKLYKTISFEWEKSKSFMNEQFNELYNRQYGSLKEVFPFDGKEFKIKLPFENLYFSRFSGTNLQVAYSTTESIAGKSYVPKVTNLYLDETTTCSFQFNDGSTTSEITSYVPLGQDLVYNTENYSSNFGLDISTLKNLSTPNSLFGIYYEDYLQSLFNDKTREVEVDCMLPLPVLTLLTLDDAIILRDKKYRINEMKSNLTSGKVTLNLLSDWVERETSVPVSSKPVKPTGGTLSKPIKPIKPVKPIKPYGGGGGYVIVGNPTETKFITTDPVLPATFLDEGDLKITVPANGTGSKRTNTLPVTYYNADGSVIKVEYIYIEQDEEKFYLLKEDGGYLLTETYDKILLE